MLSEYTLVFSILALVQNLELWGVWRLGIKSRASHSTLLYSTTEPHLFIQRHSNVAQK